MPEDVLMTLPADDVPHPHLLQNFPQLWRNSNDTSITLSDKTMQL